MALAPLSISNPTLGFRLDPGEPGMLRRGRATEATLLVTGQEHRNLVRLKSEALREGRVIIHAGIQFGRAFKGPFLTTTNGLTTVISRPARASVFESEAQRLAAEGAGSAAPAPLPPTEEEAPPPAPEAGAGRVLADEENRLRAELRRLESPGFGEPAGPPAVPPGEAGPGGEEALRPLEEAAERRAAAGREQDARSVEGELRRIQFRRTMGQLDLAASA